MVVIRAGSYTRMDFWSNTRYATTGFMSSDPWSQIICWNFPLCSWIQSWTIWAPMTHSIIILEHSSRIWIVQNYKWQQMVTKQLNIVISCQLLSIYFNLIRGLTTWHETTSYTFMKLHQLAKCLLTSSIHSIMEFTLLANLTNSSWQLLVWPRYPFLIIFCLMMNRDSRLDKH